MTQVQFFRDRWECAAIGTVIFALPAVMLVPYIFIGVMGGGQLWKQSARGSQSTRKAWQMSYELGGAIVAIVVMSYVFFGGMRGTAWVKRVPRNLSLPLASGTICLRADLSKNLGGFEQDHGRAGRGTLFRTASLLSLRPWFPLEFFSYMFIPLSAIMFPHISIMCLTARKSHPL